MAAVKAFFSFVCLALVANTFGEKFDVKECPHQTIYKPLHGYNLAAAAGKWHSYGAIVTSPIFQAFNTSIPFDEGVTQCVETDEEYNAKNKTISVSVTNKLSDKTEFKYYTEHYENSTLGNYKIQSDDVNLKQFAALPIFILATDYKSYIIKYSCIHLQNVFPYQMITIGIRHKKASVKTLAKIEHELAKLGLRLKYIHLFCD